MLSIYIFLIWYIIYIIVQGPAFNSRGIRQALSESEIPQVQAASQPERGTSGMVEIRHPLCA